MTGGALIEELRAFVAERDWSQFHSPANLAKSITIEAGELLECFQWNDDFDVEDVVGELADVLTYALLMIDRLGLNLDDVVRSKLALTRTKYPVEKSHGKSDKYDRLPD